MSNKEDNKRNNLIEQQHQDYNVDDDDDSNNKNDDENEIIYMMDLFIDYYKKPRGLIKFLNQRIANKKNKCIKDDEEENYNNGLLFHELIVQDMRKNDKKAKHLEFISYESMCDKLTQKYIELIKKNKVDEKYKTIYYPRRKSFKGIKSKNRKRMIDVFEYDEEIEIFFQKGLLMSNYYHKIMIHPSRTNYTVLFKFTPSYTDCLSSSPPSSSSSSSSLRQSKPIYFNCWNYFFFVTQDMNLCFKELLDVSTSLINIQNDVEEVDDDDDDDGDDDEKNKNKIKIQENFVRINDMEKSHLSSSLYPDITVIRKTRFASTLTNNSSSSSATILFDNHVLQTEFIRIFRNFYTISIESKITVDIEEFDSCRSDFMMLNKSIGDKLFSLKQQHRQCFMIKNTTKCNEVEIDKQTSDIERDIYFLKTILISSVFYSCCIDSTIGNSRRAFDFLMFYKQMTEKISPQMYMYYLLEILFCAFNFYWTFNSCQVIEIDKIRIECAGLLKIYYSNLRNYSNPTPDRYSFMENLFSDVI